MSESKKKQPEPKPTPQKPDPRPTPPKPDIKIEHHNAEKKNHTIPSKDKK